MYLKRLPPKSNINQYILASVSYLCRLGHSLIKGCCSTFDPFFNGFVTSLSLGVALCHRRSLLHAELGQLGSDLQQLVNVRLVFCDGLPEQLEGELKGRENTQHMIRVIKSSIGCVKNVLLHFLPSSGPAAAEERLCQWLEVAAG